jgi:hypothetical protein
MLDEPANSFVEGKFPPKILIQVNRLNGSV